MKLHNTTKVACDMLRHASPRADDRVMACIITRHCFDVGGDEVKPAADSILDEARESGADLICFALGGRGLGPGMLIGRVSEKVVRNAPCCVLALPDAWVAKHRA